MSATLQGVVRYRTALIAGAILASCFLPFFAVGDGVSLADLYRIIDTVRQALGILAPGLDMMTPDGTSVDDITRSLNLLLILYAVPVSAALAIIVAFSGRSRVAGFLNGALSVVLPIAVPFLVAAAFKSAVPADLRPMLQPRGDGLGLHNFGIGAFAIVGLGVVQIILCLRDRAAAARSATTRPLSRSTRG